MNTPGRMQAVQSPIIPVVGEWIRQHPGTISLGQGVVSYGPPPQAGQRVESFFRDPENHKYKAVQGLPELLECLHCKLREENGLEPSGETVVMVTAGANMAFMNTVLAVTDPGDEVLLQTPYYFNHEMAVTMAGCRPVLVPTDSQYQLQPGMIAQSLTPRTRAVVTISPNNPTGAVYPRAALQAVNELCRERGLYHIHDAAYESFTYGESRCFSPGSLPGAAGHTVSLYSLSKAYGFASWRIGYMTAPVHLFDSLKKIQDTILICPPVVSQHAALGALEAGAEFCREHLKRIAQAREVVLEALHGLGSWCEVPKTDGAFYFLLRLHTDWDDLALTHRLVAEHGVAVIPGRAFGLAQGCFLRVAYGALAPETVREGIGRLVDGLRKLVGERV